MPYLLRPSTRNPHLGRSKRSSTILCASTSQILMYPRRSSRWCGIVAPLCGLGEGVCRAQCYIACFFVVSMISKLHPLPTRPGTT